MKYRSTSFRVDPRQKGDGVPGIDAAVIGEIDVTTASTGEIEGSSGKLVWSGSQTYLARTSRFVFSWTDVASLCSAVERVQCYGTWWSCEKYIYPFTYSTENYFTGIRLMRLFWTEMIIKDKIQNLK